MRFPPSPLRRRLCIALVLIGVLVTTAGRIGWAAPGEGSAPGDIAAPTVTALTPAEAPLAGGPIRITGTGFSALDVVQFGGVNAAGFIFVDATTVDVIAPPTGIAGTVQVTVTNGDGTSAETPASLFTYHPPPTITGLDPATGPVAGGNTIVITGTNFVGGELVFFGLDGPHNTTPVTPGTQVSVVVPAGSLGPVNVELASGGGFTNTFVYTYVAAAAPTITGIDAPASGPTSGGNTVTINGTNLTGATKVSFGSSEVTSGITVVNATQLTVPAPARAAGAVNVTVTTPGGTSAETVAYTYAAVPTLSSITPANGPTAGGTTVTIAGADLANASLVNFGSATAVPSNASATSVTVVTPASASNASPVTVRVTTPGGISTSTQSSANTFTYADPPTISSVSPLHGKVAGGDTVTITGTNLENASLVNFGSATAVPSNSSATSVTVVTPASASNASPVTVRVTTPGGISTSTQSSANTFTYADPPTISSVSPLHGKVAGGDTVTITGANLANASLVNFGSVTAVPSNASATSVTVVTPASASNASPVTVRVTTPGGISTSTQSSANTFTYVNPPTINSLTPASGPTGLATVVTITGTNFGNLVTEVQFGSHLGQSITSISSTTLTVVAPVNSNAGAVPVTLRTPGGNASSTYTYVSPPTITGIDPASGPATGANSVTITGTNLSNASLVSFGAATAVPSNSSATSLTVAAPARSGTTSSVAVTVTTPGGTSSGTQTAANTYTFVDSPTITSVQPATLLANTPTVVTITGTNFGVSTAGITAARIEQLPFVGVLSGPTWVSATTLIVTTPASGLVPGEASVFVEILGQQSNGFAVTVLPERTVTPPTLPGGRKNTPYSQAIALSSGNVSSAVLTGTLPTGLTFSRNGSPDYLLAGTPTQLGSFPLTIAVTDSSGTQTTANYTLSIDRELFFAARAVDTSVETRVRTFGLEAPPVGELLTPRSGPMGQLSTGLSSGQTVALGDLNGDGVDDLVLGFGSTSAEGPGVRVYDGVSGVAMGVDLRPYPSGNQSDSLVYVAAGDVTGDGVADVITGPVAGALGKVKVFDGVTRLQIKAFDAYVASFTGGVTVASGDVNGDGIADIITGSASAGTHVKVFDGATSALLQSFFAYGPADKGVFVAAGDVNGDGYADVITGAGPGREPRVKVFSGPDQIQLHSFLAFGDSANHGVRVAAGDLDGDGRSEIIAGFGQEAIPFVYIFGRSTDEPILSGLADTTGDGVYVAGPSALPPSMTLESPTPGVQGSHTLTLSGWAVNRTTATGTDVARIEAWARPVSTNGSPINLTPVSPQQGLGQPRPDVAGSLGGQFVNSGFSFNAAQGLPSGTYDIDVSARSQQTGKIFVRRTVRVTIGDANLVLGVTGPISALAGSTVSYDWTVINSGAAPATGATLTLPTPAGTTVPGPLSGCTILPTLVTCTIGSVAPNTPKSVRVSLQLAPTLTGDLTYSGTVGWTAPTSGNVSGIIVTPVSPRPTITQINPAEGPASGGTVVTIQGTNLSGATRVHFGQTAVTPVAVNGSPNTLTATAPKGAAGNVNVTVTTPVATTTDTATFKYVGVVVTPPNLSFVATRPGNATPSQTPPQTITASYNSNGSAGVTYAAVPRQPWIRVTPDNVSGRFTVAVVPGQLPSNAASHSGVVAVSVTGQGITASTDVPVTLTVTARPPEPPFGAFDRPASSSTLSGTLEISGWALDNVGLDHVEIWRDPIGSESGVTYPSSDPRNGKVFVARAAQTEGARPDIRSLYPDTPGLDEAGWGYSLLTNGLPDGLLTLHAFAFDVEGLNTILGQKTVFLDNANAVKPFGTIDQPTVQMTISIPMNVTATSVFPQQTPLYIYAWTLPATNASANPTSGTLPVGQIRSVGDPAIAPGSITATAGPCVITNEVYYAFDSGELKRMDYGARRDDIANAFPGNPNSDGAGASALVDWSTLTNGMHQLGMFVIDSCGNQQGLGSRFVYVDNPALPAVAARPGPAVAPATADADPSAVVIRRAGDVLEAEPTPSGPRVVRTRSGERVVVQLPSSGGVPYWGYQVVDGLQTALPLGSSLDATAGIFYWEPAPAFLGAFDLQFGTSPDLVIRLRVVVDTAVQAVIDTPPPGDVPASFTVAGWAIEQAATSGTGIDTVHVWAYPDNGEPPVFLGVASYGDTRPDIAALFGDQFAGSSFSLEVNGLAPGTYDLVVYPHSAVLGDFQGARVVRVTVP